MKDRACCIFLACFLSVSGFAQPTDRHITLDVVVTDKSGKPVPGLQEQDFTLLDNKQPQKIVSFEAVQGAAKTDTPVEIVLLVDEVNANFTSVSFERAQIEKFLRRDGGQLPRPVSLAVLSDSGIAMSNATTQDGNALAMELTQNKAGLRSITRSQGVYGASDRIGLSLHALQELADYETPRPGRKLVIWISPGWPLLSGPRESLSSKQQESLFGSVVGLSDSLRRARITLDSIDPLGTADTGGFRTSYYEEFVKGVKKERQVQVGNLGLQVIATQSGGRVLNSNNDVASEIASAAGDANAFYVLTFDALVGDGPNEYHALDIKLDKSGLKTLTRTGYYAQPR
ncbi:MAG TPA: VWA domain-containing protein [Bryobacteraceae bacterium]|nr:VWA domain-containing protein [Bryobacteraceae bacterium]